MARISHPNVVAVYEVGTHQGQIFVAMEFVEGETLKSWQIDRPWREVLGVYAQAGAGLAAAHEVGLVHRDFKPDNVLVDRRGRARVLDFGLARAIQNLTSTQVTSTVDESTQTGKTVSGALDTPMTQTGTVMGTPAYMSPEQHIGAAADARSDQFSYCVALWEGVTGTRPFAGKTIAELVTNVVGGDISTPTNRNVPPGLLDTLRRGLATRAEDRYADMGQLLAELEPFVGGSTRRRIWPALVVGRRLGRRLRDPRPDGGPLCNGTIRPWPRPGTRIAGRR